ncbi:D-2-hydroxyacid dehydrogenase [Fredinandcohnia quinoae]|uniref:D-2-hydroxyacid dehydrogenase n=1 Tax=Fredinandcohnia quinoae TaxID=2918902 RepID=A0AAW5E8V2_9BACI|nr:D-2-hydroxyacid dehydrogenase [Fredinandcohnia sp. SECRCQ15]MCH1627914.1 D-2-hydroxyacid dehydrogenase [Fredinandcohnia sp. SECRCQ15]
MLILSTIKPKEELINKMNTLFPKDEFHYYRNMEEAQHELKNADILITYGEDLTPELVSIASKLKWIMVMSAGLDQMPFDAIQEKGILVTNARGIHKIPMAEYTISMMLQVIKQNKRFIEQQNQHLWKRTGFQTGELFGKTIGILGVGAIGGEIARLAKAFNMKVLGVNRSGKLHEFTDQMYQVSEIEEFLPKPDFIVSVLPSTDETKYLLSEKHFNLMKSDAIFINIGRGDLVKDEVLIEALKSKKISHAILDVFEQEPLPSDHPFWDIEQVTVTPHFSSKTDMYLPRSFDIFEKNFQIFKQGSNEYINKIDLERGY